MRFIIAIPTRKRPLALRMLIESAWRLKSEDNEVGFYVGVDDNETNNELNNLSIPTCRTVSSGVSPAAKMNGIIQFAQRDGYDALTLIGDKCIPITKHWDKVLEYAHEDHPHRIIWWNDPTNPNNTVPSIPKTFFDAMETHSPIAENKRYVPEYFPFWFVDTWLEEVDCLIWGRPPIRVRADFSYFPGPTSGGREFKFWCELYAKLLPMRLKQAGFMAEVLEPKDFVEGRDRFYKIFEERDKIRISNCDEYEKHMADPEPPSEMYLEAKERALGL